MKFYGIVTILTLLSTAIAAPGKPKSKLEAVVDADEPLIATCYRAGRACQWPTDCCPGLICEWDLGRYEKRHTLNNRIGRRIENGRVLLFARALKGWASTVKRLNNEIGSQVQRKTSLLLGIVPHLEF
ncbi:hypothetical protein PAAG_12370 [Paracoccidioides lutzii Pb01]|uniref:Uncharacterized protein n=1 Tax=Paracoccidioides lutzii (strain ATCC MYA-826 / Pb01) TaxID=502779 RepID=A0A0A2V0A0_PARBA|nr:hypothetical protein PAAG_12370 [Paracoccidioides lutzii Pb01]KGQ00943.1 hypothetical protein PAAG_12370 [Paracoccidioides lutzii Pb01]